MKSFRELPRDAWLLLAARGIFSMLESLLLVGLMLRVEASGAGTIANAGLMIAMAIPAVVTMSWAGRVADREDSRTILTLAIGTQIIACLVLATSLTLTPGWIMYAACLVFQAGYSFANPVWMVLIPKIVGESRVQQVAGAQMLITSVATPAGAGLAGVLVDAAGTQAVPLAGAALLVVVGILARTIRTRHTAEALTDQEQQSSTTGGMGVIRRDRVLLTVLIGAMVIALVSLGVNVVEVFFVREDLGASATQYGLTEVFFAVGTALASLIVMKLATDRNRTWAITIGFAGCAAVCVGISQIHSFYAYAGLSVLLGLANAVVNGAVGPLFLLRTPEAQRGRVMATVNGMFSTATILALFLGGMAGAWLSPRTIFLVGGLLALPFVAITGIFAVPSSGSSNPPTDEQSFEGPVG